MAELSPPDSPTPSQSTISVEMVLSDQDVKTPGRRKTSPVWGYFEFDSDSNTSVCTVKKADGENCGKRVRGKFPTNLKAHLRSVHSVEYAALCQKEESDKAAKSEQERQRQAASLKVSQQLTLAESFKKGTVYKQGSSRHHEISRKLAIFIGSSNAPTSLVENLEFRDFVRTLEPRYNVPGRSVIGKELQKVLIELKAKIGSFLVEAKKVSICADIWSKKGLSSSYLGVTCHFFSRKDHRRHCVTLAVRRLPSPHTGACIREVVDTIIAEWDIEPSKVIASLTDNGSNMVAAFREKVQTTHDEDGEESDEDEEITDREERSDLLASETLDYDFQEMNHQIEFGSLNRLSCLHTHCSL